MLSSVQLAAHGMIYVPVGYTAGAGMFDMDNMRGGEWQAAKHHSSPTAVLNNATHMWRCAHERV